MKSVICVFILLAATMTAETPQPPVATTVPKQLVHLGDVRTDNYYWLREKGRPEVLH